MTEWKTLKVAGETAVDGRTFGVRFLKNEVKAGRLRAARIGAKREYFTTDEWVRQWLEAGSTPVEVFRRRAS